MTTSINENLGDMSLSHLTPSSIHIQDDSEIKMAKAQVYRAAKCAMELHKLLKYVDNLEGWMQAKITMAADYLECVNSNLEYDIVSATMEAPMAPAVNEPMPSAVIDIEEDVAVPPQQQGAVAAQTQIKNGKPVNPYKPGTPEFAKWEQGRREGAATAPKPGQPAQPGAPVKEGLMDPFRSKDPKQVKADLRLEWLRSLMAPPSNLTRGEAGVIADQMAELGYKPSKK
jgi:hypothetical protein